MDRIKIKTQKKTKNNDQITTANKDSVSRLIVKTNIKELKTQPSGQTP